MENGQQTETVNFWADMKKTKDALNISVDTSLEESIKKQIKSIDLIDVPKNAKGGELFNNEISLFINSGILRKTSS